MELQSVRELKSLLTESVLEPLTTDAAPKAFSLSAQPLAGAGGTHRTIALGVVRKSADDYKLAVRLQRRELESSRELDLIRRKAKDEVDVRYVGRLFKRATPWYQKPSHPLKIGCSVGHYKITAGTLGCFVKSRADGRELILSNNHVLANENRAKPGDAILQPGPVDGGGNPEDAIGKLVNFVKLKKVGRNPVDCAVASIDDGVKYDFRTIKGLGKLAGLGATFLDEGTELAKLGRTTGLRRGRVTAFELDNLVVGFDAGDLRFDNQIEIEGAAEDAFSDGGDSGSLIVDADLKAVALLFAGGDQGGSNGKGLTYANPIHAVLDALKVDLLY